MKRLVLMALFVATIVVSNATSVWVLQGSFCRVDTVNHVKVGPGTTLTSLRLTGAQDLNLFYTVTDLTNPLIDMKVLKAQNTIFARQEVSGMALDNDSDSAQYFLGVNADFFNMRRGNSIGSQVSNGAPVYVDNNGRTQWAWGADRKPIMAEMTINCKVVAGNNVIKLNGVNVEERANDINLYTSLYGEQTDKNNDVLEVVVCPKGDAIAIGKTVKMQVVSAPHSGGGLQIPTDGYVISGSGNQRYLINKIKEGDEIEFSASVDVPKIGQITPSEVVSGYPVILQDGVTTNPIDILKHLNGLHPRTALGNNEDCTKLVILIVDGRSDVSEGCTSKVLADIMRYVGCDDAINLDGGGSSELYVKNLGICNVPSDGKERTVANGLYAVANVPVDNEIATIEFAQYQPMLNVNEPYTPIIYGYNKYGILIDTNVKDVKLSCDKKHGKIINKGITLQPIKEGEITLKATIGGVSTQTIVKVAK